MEANGNRYWRHYAMSAGLSKQVAKQVVAECHKRGTFNDIDYRIRVAKEVAKKGAA